MKHIWLIACVLFLSLSSTAGTGSIDPHKGQTHDYNGEEGVKQIQERGDQDESNREVQDDSNINETDSSHYSVNKFNFLFYLVYKIKYTDDGVPVEEENAVMIEE